MSEDLREVRLPGALCDEAEAKFGARFGGLEPFLRFLLQEVLRDDAAQMDQNERQIVEQRLKDLGYL